MRDLKGFIALDEKGRLGVITGYDHKYREYSGHCIEVDEIHKFGMWYSKKPHVIDSVAGLKAKASISERAFTKKGIEL